MVAEHWNDEGYPGPNKDGGWDGDAVTRKLRRFFEQIENVLQKDKKEQGELLKLFLSKWRGGKKGEWVFFDTGTMAELAINLKSAADPSEEGGITKTGKLLGEWIDYYDEYGMHKYEPMDTYDTLKWIFDLLDANKKGFFTSEENDELKQRLCNLLPWFKDVDEIAMFAKNEDVNGWQKRLEGFCEEQEKINSILDQYYIETRNDIFFEERIFDSRESVKDAQYKALALWNWKWLYVMDQILRVRTEEMEYHTDSFPVKEIVKCAIIWSLKEGDGLKVSAAYDDGKDFLQQCRELFFNIFGHKLRFKYEKDYNFVIRESFRELEQIWELLEGEPNNQKQEEERSPYLAAVYSCIDIISPSREGCIQMVPDLNCITK